MMNEVMEDSYVIKSRRKIEVNTDRQQRCYNGCHAKSEIRWTAWDTIEVVPASTVERRLAFWRSLNDYAVSERGHMATKEIIADLENKP